MRPSLIILGGLLLSAGASASSSKEGEGGAEHVVVATPVADGEAAPEAAVTPVEPATPTEVPTVNSDGTGLTSTLPDPSARRYTLRATAQFRSLLVTDEDPANDRAMLYLFRVDVRPFTAGLLKDASAFARVGLQQNFVAEIGESGLLMQDTLTGMAYRQKLDLAKWKVPRELSFNHQALVYWPTSRASLNQDLYAAPELKSDVSVQAVPHVTVGAEGRAQYRFHKYAERAGPGGGLNTRYVFGTRGYVAYDGIPLPKRYGTLELSADLYSVWLKKYPSSETFQAASSDQSPWSQSYGWDVAASYSPMKALSFSVGVEHGGSVLRNGIVNTFFMHRDETELVFTLSGKY